VRLPEHDRWSRHSHRIMPISLSTYGFCHGDRGAVGLSRMPIGRVPIPNKHAYLSVRRRCGGTVAPFATRRLMDDTRLPLDWNEQRQRLGFASAH
jgi:hypothetical protein